MTTGKYLTTNSKIKQVYEHFCLPVCKKYGINQTAFDILLFLNINPNCNTARDICEMRMIKSSLLSVTVEKLIRSRFLIRENDKSDRRVQRLILTGQSEQFFRDAISAQEQFEAAIFQELTAEELSMFETVIEKVTAAAGRFKGDTQ